MTKSEGGGENYIFLPVCAGEKISRWKGWGGGKNKIFWGNIYRWKKPENMWQTRIPTDSPLWKDP